MDTYVAKHFHSFSGISCRDNRSTKIASNENKHLQLMTNKEFINYLNRAFVLINVAFENNEDSRMYKSLCKYYYFKVPSEQKEIESYIKEYEYCLIKYFSKTSQDKTNEKIIDRVSNSNLKDGNVEVEFSIVQITSYLEASISKRTEKEHNTIDLEISDFVKENERTKDNTKEKLVEVYKAYLYLKNFGGMSVYIFPLLLLDCKRQSKSSKIKNKLILVQHALCIIAELQCKQQFDQIRFHLRSQRDKSRDIFYERFVSHAADLHESLLAYEERVEETKGDIGNEVLIDKEIYTVKVMVLGSSEKDRK